MLNRPVTIEPPIVTQTPGTRQSLGPLGQECRSDLTETDHSKAIPTPWLGNDNWIATIWLVGSFLCVALAAGMQVGDDRRVFLPGLSEPVPELCTLYSRFGIDCPGCGLTRTFIYMAHGQLVSAWHTNPVAIFVFLFACWQIPMGAAQVIFRIRNSFIEAWGCWNDWCTAGLLIALLVQWAIRLVF